MRSWRGQGLSCRLVSQGLLRWVRVRGRLEWVAVGGERWTTVETQLQKEGGKRGQSPSERVTWLPTTRVYLSLAEATPLYKATTLALGSSVPFPVPCTVVVCCGWAAPAGTGGWAGAWLWWPWNHWDCLNEMEPLNMGLWTLLAVTLK